MKRELITLWCPTCGADHQLEYSVWVACIGHTRKADCSGCLHRKSVAFDALGHGPALHVGRAQ